MGKTELRIKNAELRIHSPAAMFAQRLRAKNAE